MRAVIAQERPDPLDEVRLVLFGLGLECHAADCILFPDLSARLAKGPVDLILVRAEPGGEAAQAAIRRTGQLTGAPVMAYGPVADARHILEVGRCGACEYLDEERLRPDLEAALGRLRRSHGEAFQQGTVAAVASVTPGCGVTTVSTNLAFAWGQPQLGWAVLVELGRPPADVVLSLDLEPRHSVTEVCARWQELDAAIVRQGLVQHPNGVFVLCHKLETLAANPIEPKAVHPLLVLLRSLFANSVLDLGHMLETEHYEAMRQSDQVVVVVRLDVPGVRQARRLLKRMQEEEVPSDKIFLVANRYGQSGQVPWRKAEETLGASFLEYIPDDPALANEALNHGLPLVHFAPKSRISRKLARLAEQLVEQRGMREQV